MLDSRAYEPRSVDEIITVICDQQCPDLFLDGGRDDSFDLLLVAVFAGPEGSGSVYQTVKIDNTQYAKELVEPGTRLR